MKHCPRYQPPYPGGNPLRGLGEMMHDPYGLGFRIVAPDQPGPHYPCRHSAIYAVSLYPGLGLAQFSNPEGLVLPVVIPPANRPAFEKMMAGAYARQLRHLRGHGRFALRLTRMGAGRFAYCPPDRKKAMEGTFSSFVTYYLAPSLEETRFLQDGPSPKESGNGEPPTGPECPEYWRALYEEREALRAWLADDHPSPAMTDRASDLFPFPANSPALAANSSGHEPRAPIEDMEASAPWNHSA
ncbi:hypothetical protein R5R73_02715 [Salinicola sp. LHM]|uniref:hypothetical protein n=1 Tax=Salinicola sp. LHM TaxID=3065298 RepID=UPI002ACE67D8|nr:hypothetical protein [Salinicola sp. LHM]WQH33608.1 hypothetical protein R5R73_02715 [Salinicola sp. LHM]